MPNFGYHSTVSKTIAATGDYAANDVLSESATNGVGTAWHFKNIGSAAPNDDRTNNNMIYRAFITCSEDSVACRFRLHLFNAAIVSSELDDNAARSLDNDDRENYMGYIDFPAMADFGEFSCASSDYLRFGFSGQDLYGILVTLDAETNETASMEITISLYSV